MEHAQQLFGDFFGPEWGPAIFLVAKNILLIVAIVLPLMLAVAYLTFAERKIIGYMQLRVGPNRVTFFGIPWLGGWAQPIADAVKAVMKEIIIPSGANKFLFVLAPVLTFAPALAAWAVVPFSPEVVLADINAGSALYSGHDFNGCLWSHHCGLGIQFEVCIPRRDAFRRAGGFV